jgi:hypothetical protein
MSDKHYRAIQTRFSLPEYEQIDSFRREQPEIPPMSEAVRILVDEAITARAKRTSAKAAE